MPNTGRVQQCPFFVREYKSNITCEDTIRRFDKNKKEQQMDTYCDTDNWKRCKFAKAIESSYDHGNFKDHRIRVQEKELRKANIAITQLETDNKEKDLYIEDLKKSIRDKKLELGDVQRREEKAFLEIAELGRMVEAKVAYLMWKTGTYVINEQEFKKWYETYEYRLVPLIRDEEVKSYTGEVRRRQEDGTKGSSGEPAETGREETDGTGSDTKEAE